MEAGDPWVRWPPWSSLMARMVAPWSISAWYTARLAFAPACGCTLAWSAPKSDDGPLPGEVFDLVDDLVPAVVPPARVTLGVLVGEHRARGGEHRRRGEVLRRDQLQRGLLAAELLPEERRHLGVGGEGGLVAAHEVPSAGVRGVAPGPPGSPGVVAPAARCAKSTDATGGPGEPVRSPGHGPRPAHPRRGRGRAGHRVARSRHRTGRASRAAGVHGDGALAAAEDCDGAPPAGTPRPDTALVRRADSIRVVAPLGWRRPTRPCSWRAASASPRA